MLLPLLAVTAVLISSISFVAMLLAPDVDSRQPAQKSIFPNKQFSLGSFVFFLFFPTVSKSSASTKLPISHCQRRMLVAPEEFG